MFDLIHFVVLSFYWILKFSVRLKPSKRAQLLLFELGLSPQASVIFFVTLQSSMNIIR